MKVKEIYTVFLLLIGLFGCKQSSMDQYEALVERERKSSKQANDLFFGIALGMTSKNFYLHCWDMNKKGLFMDGLNNTSVSYKLVHSELQYPAEMNFYPEFQDGRIYKMAVRFQYSGWAPWNKELDSDDLLADVVKLYKKWYPGGNDFIAITDKTQRTIYVKVDGNRRIIIGRYDDVQVKADYTDLRMEEKKK